MKVVNDWNDESKDYIIGVIHKKTDIDFASTQPIFDFRSEYEIHIFVKTISEGEPEEVGEMEKEVERILIENPSALLDTQGVSLVHILDYRQVIDESSSSTNWHYV